MKPEIKKRWIEALLSGEYKQGNGYLRKDIGDDSFFCCLGVLCDLYIKDVGSIWCTDLEATKISDSDYCFIYSVENSIDYAFIPEEVMIWSGLTESDPEVTHIIETIDEDGNFEEENQTLSHLNDIGYKFKRISEIIEENM